MRVELHVWNHLLHKKVLVVLAAQINNICCPNEINHVDYYNPLVFDATEQNLRDPALKRRLISG